MWCCTGRKALLCCEKTGAGERVNSTSEDLNCLVKNSFTILRPHALAGFKQQVRNRMAPASPSATCSGSFRFTHEKEMNTQSNAETDWLNTIVRQSIN